MTASSVRERLFVRLDGDPPRAPESSVPASALREFVVPAGLRHVVASATAYQERLADGVDVVERVLPDGASRLLVLFTGSTASVHVAGARTGPVLVRMRGSMHGLSITLRPGALLELLGTPAEELAGRTVPWDTLVPPKHRDVPAQLEAAPDDAARVGGLFGVLTGMRKPSDPSARRVIEYATGTLSQRSGGGSVRGLATELGLSERRVQQLFAGHLGVTPGAWRRVQRMHRTLRLLRETDAPQWSRLALEAGYYDQAHLINEFRALCGLTPGQLVRGVSDSSNP